jgi:hypothetical protein
MIVVVGLCVGSLAFSKRQMADECMHVFWCEHKLDAYWQHVGTFGLEVACSSDRKRERNRDREEQRERNRERGVYRERCKL